MAKKTTEKDVLIVRDEKTGEISVVAGLNADGSPKRTPAKAENAQSFLQFDRHGDVLDNFFKNFFRQCKEPSRFGFYRVAADQADKLMEVMKDLLKDPEGNKEMLAPHKVDTSGYEKKVQEEQSAEKQEQPGQKQDDEPKKQEEMEQKNEQNQENPQQAQSNRGYQPIDESKINWKELEEKWGVKRDDLEKSGDLDRMLNYGKSDLVRVSPNFGGEAFELDARLSFKKDGEGNVSLVPHFIRKEQKLDEYKEHKFSDDDRKNLRETGNLGRVVDLVDRETGEIIPSFVSIDRKTNEITDVPANKVRIPERIGKTEITKQEQDMLRAGLPVRDKLIERKDGRKFVTTLQVNVEQRGVEFVPGTGRSPRAAQAQEAKNNVKRVKEAAKKTAATVKKVLTSKVFWILMLVALLVLLVVLLINGIITVICSAVSSLFAWMCPDGDTSDETIKNNIGTYISQIQQCETDIQAEIDAVVNSLAPEYRYDGTQIQGLNQFANSKLQLYDYNAVLAVLATQKYQKVLEGGTDDFYFTVEEIREAVEMFYSFTYYYGYDYCPNWDCSLDENCLLSLSANSFEISGISYNSY